MTTSYSSIRSNINTGDLVLFSGKGHFSNIIKLGTLSKWSHCGLILKVPEYDFIAIWESTTLSNIKDLESGKLRKGVQLVPLSDRINKYNGDIAIRHLQGADLPENSVKKLMDLRKELRGKYYEKSKVELFKAAYDGPLGKNQEDLSSIFCSELVAEAYQRLGLFSETKPSNEYTPADFADNKMRDLKNEFYLSDEILVKDI